MSESGNQDVQSWKSKTYMTGGLAGLIVGLLSAYLYARASEEVNTEGGPERIKTLDGLKLAVALLGVIRQITDLGTGGGKK